MSVPSMVHRSGDSLIVRSVVSGDALFGSADAAEDDDYVDVGEANGDSVDQIKDLPDCKVKRNYSCSTCDFFTQNPRHFLYHLRDVHKEKVKIYECPNCLYASKHFQKLLRHTKMVHGTHDGVEAPEVSRKSRKRSAPVEEDDANPEVEGDPEECVDDEPDRPTVFKCSVCSFTGRSQSQLSKHEREEHIKTKFFRCSKCTYVTHIKARFTKHVKYHSMPMIKCDMCDFRTPYKWNLDRHCKNHNGRGAFRCSACNFTADIKQSLTVHEMNHHVPPVGQAAGLGVGRRRNKVGASDATAAEEAAQAQQQTQVGTRIDTDQAIQVEDDQKKAKVKITPKKPKITSANNDHNLARNFGGSDFINPDDIIHHSNGKVYFKNKCKLCNFKSAWDSEMAKHEKKVHNILKEEISKPVIAKKTPRPIPNLIPMFQNNKVNNIRPPVPHLKAVDITELQEPTMSEKDISDICAKSANSSLKDFATLFNSEDMFAEASNNNISKVPDLIPAHMLTSTPNNNNNKIIKNVSTEAFKQKNKSFFDKFKEKLEKATDSSSNLICKYCGHESTCLTEQAKHQKTCGKESKKLPNVVPIHNISSSRCQYCRQRCKSSTDLYNHLLTCVEAQKSQIKEEYIKEEVDNVSEHEGELRIDEDRLTVDESSENKPHPMENKVFVWNDIHVPMDIEVDDSNYEYTEDKIDDTASLDLSIRTQSPGGSENSYLGQEYNSVSSSMHHSPTVTDKVPTHGNDISIAQHKRVFKCPHCTFWASTASRFHVHIVGHLNKKPFECSLCAYRSNWRWDITKHIKLKSVRDPNHESAKVLMTDETGRRNYTKYNKYLTEIPVTGEQSMDTSGGSGTRPKHHDRNSSPSTKSDLPKLTRAPNNNDFSPLLRGSPGRPPPALKVADGTFFAKISDKKRPSTESKRTLFKCKKCNFRDASREVLLQHVKGHYQHQQQPVPTSSHQQETLQTLRGNSPDKDEASLQNCGTKGSQAPFRCGHCNQVSNWKHVIQRHCRLKHNGDIRVVSNKNGQEKIEVEEQIDEPEHEDVPQEGTFKCNSCPFSNDDDVEFEQHLTGHISKPDAIKCHFCKFYVTQKDELIEHLRLHGKSDPEDFLNKMMERSPLGDVDGKKFQCMICPYVTNSKSQYTYHKQFHKPRGGQYTCSHCTYNVSKRHLLHQHLKVHGLNYSQSKANGDITDLEEISDEIEEVTSSIGGPMIDMQNLPDIPLVWVSKNGKFSKMYKCRYCPHVNLRKVNIQEHERMHSVREKNPNSSRTNDVEHKCGECNYVCNNAGVLSSHSKVHLGMYGTIHRIVDQSRTDEEQIREMTNQTSAMDLGTEDYENAESFNKEHNDAETGSVLYFCKECPARFLRDNEFSIHNGFHNARLFYKCEYCTYTARQKKHLINHSKVHTNEYQDRTKELQTMHPTNPSYPQPVTYPVNKSSAEVVWMVEHDIKPSSLDFEMNYISKPSRSSVNVPLSGTELFQQKSEAQQKHAAEQAAQLLKESSPPPLKPADPQFGTLMLGNPEFIYPTCLKNGRVKEKRYKCHKCPSAFEKREQYKVHLGLHGAKQRYKCEHCDYSVKYYANYVQHLRKHQQSNDAVRAARRASDPTDENDIDIEENVEVTSDFSQIENSDSPKLSLAEQQALAILQQRKDVTTTAVKDNTTSSAEEKRLYWCPSCPYTNFRKDAVDNHQKRHVSVSGNKSSYTCEHCDYSVPQAHFLRDHSKLHFMPNKVNQVDGFMMCDNLKLTSNKLDKDVVKEEKLPSDIVFEEKGSKVHDKQFSPPLSADVAERFNNNEGEKQFVNTQTGELVDKKETSDIQSSDEKEGC